MQIESEFPQPDCDFVQAIDCSSEMPHANS